jgi:hypothetical protein
LCRPNEEVAATKTPAPVGAELPAMVALPTLRDDEPV